MPDLVGRYEIVRVLGQGAMGRVLLAHDPVVDRDVAIKMLRTDLEIGLDVRASLWARMRHEARAAARVAHPNIVTLHDMIDDERHGTCLVFEFVPGHTLKERIAQGALAPSLVARIAREVGDALALAHEAGVLHRDIKPENIMMATHGAKIADFGIARVPDSTLTRTGGLLGTPAYCAPETISGGGFSPASDQFSFGATMYEALSGMRAFPGDDAVTVASRIAIEQPKPVAQTLGLDGRVDEVLLRSMSKKPGDRFDSVRTFGSALAGALDGTVDPAAKTLIDPRSIKNIESDTRPLGLWWSVGLGGAAVGALVGILGVTMLRPSSQSAIDLVTARALAASASSEATPTAPPPPRPRPRIEPPAPAPVMTVAVPAVAIDAGAAQSDASAAAPDASRDAAGDSAPADGSSDAGPKPTVPHQEEGE